MAKQNANPLKSHKSAKIERKPEGHTVFIPKRVKLAESEKEPNAAFIRIAGIRLGKIQKLSERLASMAHNAKYDYDDKAKENVLRILKHSYLTARNAFQSDAVEKGNGKVSKRVVYNPLA